MEINFTKNCLIKHWNYKSCPACSEVEDLFRVYNMSYSIIVSDKAIFGEIIKKSGSMDVPQVILNGKFIGGLAELKKYLNEG